MKIIYISAFSNKVLNVKWNPKFLTFFLKPHITSIYFLPILQFVAFSGAMFSGHMMNVNITLFIATVFISKQICANQNISNKRRTRQGNSSLS
jgi:hypothetical protein